MSKLKATHAQAQLLLQLYDLRREPILREARKWFGANFYVKSPEDVQRLAPPGSQENAYIRMVVSYWEQACLLLNQGLLDKEQFFTVSGEFYMVWLRVKAIAPSWRELYKNPHFFGNVEKAAHKYEKWADRRAPGSVEVIRTFMTAPPAETGKD